MKNKFLRASTIIFVALISLLFGIISSFLYFNLDILGSGDKIQENQNLVTKILLVDKNFRSSFLGSFTDSSLIDGMITGYLKASNDRFASYVKKSDHKAYENYLKEGTLKSTGIAAAPDENGRLVVRTVLKNSPADKLKIVAGDVITSINNSLVSEMGYLAALGKLVLSSGSSVDLTWERGSLSYSAKMEYSSSFNATSVSYKIFTADMFKNPNTDDVPIDNTKKVAYIHISYFGENTLSELTVILNELGILNGSTTSSQYSVIVDLRNNFGGDISTQSNSEDGIKKPVSTLIAQNFSSIADIFVHDGNAFSIKNSLSETGDDSNDLPFYFYDDKEVVAPITVLVNENTAREAELLALILKTKQQATVIGAKTAGINGLLAYYDLGDETAFCITTRYYALADGTVFDSNGVNPDYPVSASSPDFEHLTLGEDSALKTALSQFGFEYEEKAEEESE